MRATGEWNWTMTLTLRALGMNRFNATPQKDTHPEAYIPGNPVTGAPGLSDSAAKQAGQSNMSMERVDGFKSPQKNVST